MTSLLKNVETASPAIPAYSPSGNECALLKWPGSANCPCS